MDTSKEYIKMCKMAEEIQNLFKEVDGDVCYVEESKTAGVESGLTYFIGEHIWTAVTSVDITKGKAKTELAATWAFANDNSVDLIWLPRQDQLQNMVLDLSKHTNRIMKPLFEMVETFYDFVWEVKYKIDSYEQLWLAFVMKEKYNKTWTGNNWE